MSADNYMLIRTYKGSYVVTTEFASDGEPEPITPATFTRGLTRVFATHDEAMAYASSEYAEYGIEDESFSTYRDEIRAERDAEILAIIDETCDPYSSHVPCPPAALSAVGSELRRRIEGEAR